MKRNNRSPAADHQSPFVDRCTFIRLVTEQFDRLGEDPSFFKVIVISGIGGVGKSRLLSELRIRLQEIPDHRPVQISVPLDGIWSGDEISTLVAIRRKLDFDCLLFDTAVVEFWTMSGQPVTSLTRDLPSKSLIYRVLDAAAGLVPLMPPPSLGADIARIVAQDVNRRRLYGGEDFAEIDELRESPRALRNRLSKYLARDLAINLEHRNGILVAFYDSYESQGVEVTRRGAGWLQELIDSTHRGVHIVTSRYPVAWGRDWGADLLTLDLDGLPEQQAREMVQQRVPGIASKYVDRIVSAACRVPFFIEAGIEIYEYLVSSDDAVPLDRLAPTQHECLERLLWHLPRGFQDQWIALATCQVFDEALFDHLARRMNNDVPIGDFDSFMSSFAVGEIESGIYRTHDLLTDFVRRSPNLERLRRKALHEISLNLSVRLTGHANAPLTETAILLRGAFQGWASIPEIEPEDVGLLVDSAYALYDAGLWTELPKATNLDGARLPESHPVNVCALFFDALVTRRTQGTREAIESLALVEPHAARLGKHASSVIVETAYLSEISGNYNQARIDFSRLYRETQPFDVTDRTHRRSRLLYCDMLTMDGDLDAANRLLGEFQDSTSAEFLDDWIEYVRARGHAYRFSLLPSEAVRLYRMALSKASAAPALIGKLHTNLAEAQCWDSPSDALTESEFSRDVNQRLGNRIEMAKCDAARSIALAKLGDFDFARQEGRRAVSEARACGYPAGEAFALQALAVTEGLANERVALRTHTQQLQDLVASLGTYSHLLVVPAFLCGVPPDESAPETLWIDSATFEDRLVRYVSQ